MKKGGPTLKLIILQFLDYLGFTSGHSCLDMSHCASIKLNKINVLASLLPAWFNIAGL